MQGAGAAAKCRAVPSHWMRATRWCEGRDAEHRCHWGSFRALAVLHGARGRLSIPLQCTTRSIARLKVLCQPLPQRHRVCTFHYHQESLELDGATVRFCQQVGRAGGLAREGSLMCRERCSCCCRSAPATHTTALHQFHHQMPFMLHYWGLHAPGSD